MKAVVALVLTGLVLLSMALGIVGILDPARSGWVEAGTGILGILVPILLIVLVVGYSQTGVEALVAKSAEYLARTILQAAVMLREPSTEFRKGPVSLSRAHRTAPPHIEVQASSNMSVANYIVEAAPTDGSGREPRRLLIFRVELNATKVNVNLLIANARLAAFAQARNLGAPKIDDLFPHTIAGARHEGYWFNDRPIARNVGGHGYWALVATRRLDPGFLLSPVHRLDFAQDLMLMLRAALNEEPDLFELVTERDGG